MLKREILPGLGLTAAVAFVAFLIIQTQLFNSIEVVALVGGFLLANLLKPGPKFLPGIVFSEKKVLGWAIALLGLQLNFSKFSMSLWFIPFMLLFMLAVIFMGWKWAKRFSVNDTCGYLIGVGTAVCGASAIAAASSVMKTKVHETGVAVGVVNLLATLGMITLPVLAAALGLSAEDAGILVGGSLQGMGHVVGAGYALGDQAGEVATLVKLGRVLMLGPIMILTALLMFKHGGTIDRKRALPGFIIVFLILLVVANVFALPAEALSWAKTIDKIFMSIAMAGIGMQIKFGDITKQGPRALLLGTLIFVALIALLLGFIYGQNYFS